MVPSTIKWTRTTPGRAYLGLISRRRPDLTILTRSGCGLSALGETSTLIVQQEAFLDRAYRTIGTLVPRGKPGAVLQNPSLVLDRIRDSQDRGAWRSIDDCWISLDPDTLCVHGDTSQAVAMLTQLRTLHPRAHADGPSRR